MRMKKLSTVILLMFGLTIGLMAQNAIATSGGNGSGGGGTVSYTIGQVFYMTSTGSTGAVSEGVQQPYEILTVGIDDPIAVDMRLSAYPNPTTDFLTLNVENYEGNKLSYQLFNLSGNLLSRKAIFGNTTQINMANLIASIYILKIIDNKQTIKTFKIIKN